MDILAADIGGTHARFALVRTMDGSSFRLRHSRVHPTAALRAPEDTIRAFLDEAGAANDTVAIAIAVAGPVVDGYGRLTNLPWRVSARALERALPCSTVRVLNDFEALGHAVPVLGEADTTVIQAGSADRGGPLVVLGPGTGLGQALIVPDRAPALEVLPTEGGHATFAPRTELEWHLRTFLSERHGGHVSWERILSGGGLASVYDFLVATGRHREDPDTRRAMGEEDPAAVIVAHGLARSDLACDAALDTMVAVFGSRAGNLALSAGASGGVYLAGGMTLRIRERLREGGFLEAFRAKGRLSPWLTRIPVKVIDRDDAGLLGAALTVLPESMRVRMKALPSRSHV